MEENAAEAPENEVSWKPLTAKQRRVLGTLMEKSKTTPDAYPMSFSGLVTGCNQKTNRTPIANYTVEQVEAIVDELRELGAVTLVQGSGRVTKVRHYAYQWLGLNKAEGAILTELLLRGEQTVGELRSRVARMEPISDLDELKRMLDELKRRNLVVELTPPGRGQVVSHNVYPEWELEAVRKTVAAGASAAGLEEVASESHGAVASAGGKRSIDSGEVAELRAAIEALVARVARLENAVGLTEE
jgi:uncharacterized protein YceH (UPF0502 family)